MDRYLILFLKIKHQFEGIGFREKLYCKCNISRILLKQGQKVVHKNVSQGCNLIKRSEKRDIERDIEIVRERDGKNEMESERSAQFEGEASTDHPIGEGLG